jgi:general stress protein 26
MPCDLLNEFAYDKDHGDNGKRIEVCKIWVNYPDIKICDLPADEVIKKLESEKSIIISTCADNRVTIRTMSHVNDGLTIYFQTGKDYLKCQQIRQNPNVAVSIGGYDIEGKATLLGHPLEKENSMFMKLFGEKHTEYKNVWSDRPEEIVVKIEIKSVKQWRYINSEPYIAIGHF